MSIGQKDAKQPSTMVQLLVNFVIPIIVLTKFSGEDQLGPVGALLVSLALPVGFELYSISKRRKFSYLSLLAIGGLLVTGLVALLELSEQWLAVRRAVPYLFAAAAVLVSFWIKRSLIMALLAQLLDLPRTEELAKGRKQLPALHRHFRNATYLTALLCVALAVISYVLTLHVIDGAPGSAAFNEDYARLRIMSLPAVTLPMFVGVVGIFFYVMTAVERATGVEADTLLKKKK
jgi:hypothetical protein